MKCLKGTRPSDFTKLFQTTKEKFARKYLMNDTIEHLYAKVTLFNIMIMITSVSVQLTLHLTFSITSLHLVMQFAPSPLWCWCYTFFWHERAAFQRSSFGRSRLGGRLLAMT